MRNVFLEAASRLLKYRRLREWETLEAAELRSRQRRRLRALLEYAREQVPYYRRHVPEVPSRTDTSSTVSGMLEDVPVLTKEHLRRHGSALQSERLDSFESYSNATGGSTGEPVTFIQHRSYRDWAAATKYLFDRWTGYRIGQPKVVLWGSERDLLEEKKSWGVKISRRLKNEHWINAFQMTSDEMEDYLETIDDVQPVLILAYVQAVYELGQFIEERGRPLHQPEAVMTSAGTLTEHKRAVIEEVFGAPVYNRYGSREVGDMACECASGRGLHICPVTHVVEVVDDAGEHVAEGEEGEVVVTSLTNFAMPMVRYRIGDRAIWAGEGCECGRAWPKLENVTGRVSDMFVREDGTRVHGEFFTHLFYFEDWVEAFQVIQEDYAHVVVHIQPRSSTSKPESHRADLEEIRTAIKRAMGAECRVDVRLEERIPHPESGKFRYTVSRVSG